MKFEGKDNLVKDLMTSPDPSWDIEQIEFVKERKAHLISLPQKRSLLLILFKFNNSVDKEANENQSITALGSIPS